MTGMSKGDRDQLIRLVGVRARQAKAEAERRQAVLLANEICHVEPPIGGGTR